MVSRLYLKIVAGLSVFAVASLVTFSLEMHANVNTLTNDVMYMKDDTKEIKEVQKEILKVLNKLTVSDAVQENKLKNCCK